MALTRPRAAQIYDIDYKQATRVVTVSDITLSGGAPSLVDGVTLSVNDRVLVTGQSTASQNGVYFVSVLGTGSSGTWLRTTDTNTTGELLAGTIIMVTEGVTYHDTQWKLTTDDPITIGVTALTFVQNYSANSISAGTSNVSVTSNANVTISSAGTANVLTVSNTGAYVTGIVSATGNITGSYIIGNGSQLTGLPAGYANADVANYLASGNDTSNIITTGNISGTYILGNGSFLTGVITSVSNISNGTSNVSISSANGNITMGVAGIGNVAGNIAVISNTGVFVSGLLSSSGNIYGPGIINTTSPTPPVTPAVGDTWYDSSTDTMFRYVYDGNNYFWQDISGGSIAANVQVYGNSNVASFLSSFGSNTISTTGNITGSYIIGNGSQLTGLPAGYANSDVATYLSSGTVSTNINTTAAMSATGNVTGGNINTGGMVSAIGNVKGANIQGTNFTGAEVSVTGNITGNYFIGNGSQLTGLPAGYGNANLANIGSNTISTTGNISGGYFLGNGSQLTGLATSIVVGTLTTPVYCNLASASTLYVLNTANSNVAVSVT